MSKRLISVFLFTVLSVGSVPALSPGYSPQRDRKVVPTPTPQASPVPTPSPSPVQTPSPSPSTAPIPPRVATTTKSLAELQTRIAEILRKPELAPAMVAVKIASLDTGRVLFEENAHKLVRPASNMKLYTIAAALDRLSPDFRFTTSVQAPAKPDTDGTIRGDLTIYGRGDPSIAARFNNGDYYKGIDDLATRIAAAGVKRVEGDLVGDESYFTGPQFGSGWEWEDLTWYFGAEVSPLTVNDNALDLFIKPGQVGSSALVTTGPIDPLLITVNRAVTVAKGTRRNLTIYRGLGENILEISGTIPVDDKGYTGGIAISHPALLFIQMLRAALAQHGVTVTGKLRTTDGRPERTTIPRPANAAVQTSGPRVEITNMQSPPMSVVAAQTLKPSQNLYAELVLRTLGKSSAAAAPDANSDSERTSEDAGLEVVKAFLKEAGLSPDTLVLSDGSGLSRNDMITAEGTVQLLTYMSRQKYATVWRDALPIAGVDGTLRNRMKGTPAENNLRAKTGSLSSASSLSGYVTSASGENLVFSIMVNNYPRDAEPRTVCIDPIAVLLASFAGRSL